MASTFPTQTERQPLSPPHFWDPHYVPLQDAPSVNARAEQKGALGSPAEGAVSAMPQINILLKLFRGDRGKKNLK